MSGRIDGKRALVTGAASGIGRAAAIALAQSGADVVGIDRASPEDPPVPLVIADVGREAEVKQAVVEVADRLGGVDILVNCAGIERDSSIREFDLAEFDLMFAVNVRGVALVTREALRRMGTGARIINIASELAYLGRAGASGYCATKGAVLSLTRSWARELAPDILVNAIAPGPIDTPLLGFETMKPEVRALELSYPLGRIGTPEEVAAAVVFLASPGATFITGQCLGVDGGAAMR